MHEKIQVELAAMRTAHSAIAPLDEAGRRRAVMWLAGELNIELAGYDPGVAREALAAAEAGR